MVKKNNILISSLLALLLTGCSSNYQSNIHSNAEKDLKNHVFSSLDQSIERINKSIMKVQGPNRAVVMSNASTSSFQKTVGFNQGQKEYKRSVEPQKIANTSVSSKETKVNTIDFNRKINLNWNGEVSQLLKFLAQKIDLKFIETGKPHHVKVKFEERGVTVKDVLAKADKALKGKADIKISTANKTLELKYK